MKKLNLVTAAIALGLALGATAVADTLKAPTPVKPAQPATMPVTTVPAQPAVKSPTTPTTPVIGKKPGTGPVGRTGVLKALVSTLRVNNSTGPVTIGLSGTATVSWDLSSTPNASGIHLLVDTSSLESVNCTTPPPTASPDSGKYTTSPRALTLTNAYYRNGQAYYIKGCAFTRTTDPFGQVTDSYTGDWTNQVVLRVDGRPDLVVLDAAINVVEPFYKVGPDWFEKDLDAITRFPPQFIAPGFIVFGHIFNQGLGQADAYRAILTLNGKKYPSDSLAPLAPGRGWSLFFPVPADLVWSMYQLGGAILGTVDGTVDVHLERGVAESNTGNNSKRTRVSVYLHRPNNLRVTRTGAEYQLVWMSGSNSLASGYHVVVRYALGLTRQTVSRIFTTRYNFPGTVSYAIPPLPWRDMVNNRACFRVVGFYDSTVAIVSAPSNEVCFVVRDRRN